MKSYYTLNKDIFIDNLYAYNFSNNPTLLKIKQSIFNFIKDGNITECLATSVSDAKYKFTKIIAHNVLTNLTTYPDHDIAKIKTPALLAFLDSTISDLVVNSVNKKL